jgi:hypothetical protein
MPRRQLLTIEHLPELRQAVNSKTLKALSVEYGVSLSTMSSFLRKHGVLPGYDGWRPERYDKLLSAAARGLSLAEMAALVSANTADAEARLEQLLATINGSGFTLSQLAIVTCVDRVYWRQYIHEGWLDTVRAGRTERVLPEALARAATARPELFDYRAVPPQLSGPLGLHRLPEPQAYKLITCRSSSIEARQVDIPAGEEGPRIRYEIQSCASIGGLDLWAPMYSITTCPRCGLRVSRFSEKRVYADTPGDSTPVKDAMASKIGLRWKDGHFETLRGRVLDAQALARHVTRITQRNSRERDRKLKLIADIEQYQAGSGRPIL